LPLFYASGKKHSFPPDIQGKQTCDRRACRNGKDLEEYIDRTDARHYEYNAAKDYDTQANECNRHGRVFLIRRIMPPIA
jgi:hypothetical protein